MMKGMSSSPPTFLVAAPTLDCSFFGRSVVLLVDHDEEGSFGFVINKRSALNMPEILRELGMGDHTAAARVPVVRGGPVSPETGWVVFDPREAPMVPGDAMLLDDALAVTASVEMLEAIGRGQSPQRAMLALGYAGWSAGQLEEELREGSWIPIDVDLDVLFEVDHEERWEKVLALQGIQPWSVVPRGSAQA